MNKKKSQKEDEINSGKIIKHQGLIEKIPEHIDKKSYFTTRYSLFYSICCFLKRLKLHVYRATLVQENHWIHKTDFTSENGSQTSFPISTEELPRWITFFFSDEAWFHQTGYINAKNYRYWYSENTNIFRETGLHPEKIGVWCALSIIRIMGPIFFSRRLSMLTRIKTSSPSLFCF